MAKAKKPAEFEVRIVVSLQGNTILYDGGWITGGLRFEGDGEWTLRFERSTDPGQDWQFHDISFQVNTDDDDPPDSDGNVQSDGYVKPVEVFTGKTVAPGLITVKNNLTRWGRYRYTLSLENGIVGDDPEIDNQPDPSCGHNFLKYANYQPV